MQLRIAAGQIEPCNVGKCASCMGLKKTSSAPKCFQHVEIILVAEAEGLVAGNADFGEFGFRSLEFWSVWNDVLVGAELCVCPAMAIQLFFEHQPSVPDLVCQMFNVFLQSIPLGGHHKPQMPLGRMPLLRCAVYTPALLPGISPAHPLSAFHNAPGWRLC